MDFPVPVGASDGCVSQNPLYGFKIAAADNRLMHIFCDVPLAPVYIVVAAVNQHFYVRLTFLKLLQKVMYYSMSRILQIRV